MDATSVPCGRKSQSVPRHPIIPWTAAEEQAVIDALLRGQVRSVIAKSIMPNRPRAALSGRLTILYGKGAKKPSHAKKLPLSWSLKMKDQLNDSTFSESQYTSAEEVHLIEWLTKGCTGFNGLLFDDSHSVQSLRLRLGQLELALLEEGITGPYHTDYLSVIPQLLKFDSGKWPFMGQGLRRPVQPEGPPINLPSNPTTDDPVLRSRLRLDWGEDEREAFIQGLKVVEVDSSLGMFPVDWDWFAESDVISGLWDDFILNRKDPDNRLPKRALRRQDGQDFQYILGRDESAVFVDKDTRQIQFVVIRAFLQDDDLLHQGNELCKREVFDRINLRYEDPGAIVHAAYSTGDRANKAMAFAKNLASAKWTEEQMRERTWAFESFATLAWNMAISVLPSQITADFHNTIDHLGLPGLDCNQLGRGAPPRYMTKLNDTYHEFTGMKAAPPFIVCAVNYSRPTHHERNSNNWVVSLTTGRSVDDSRGNHFYVAEFGGILIRSAPDTLVAFRPKIYHGTTLPERSPNDDKPLNTSNFYQGGLSFVLPKGAQYAWGKRKEMWAKEARAAKMAAKGEQGAVNTEECQGRNTGLEDGAAESTGIDGTEGSSDLSELEDEEFSELEEEEDDNGPGSDDEYVFYEEEQDETQRCTAGTPSLKRKRDT